MPRSTVIAKPSPTADQILERVAIDRLIEELAIPHRARYAYRQLVGLGRAALPAVEEGLLSDNVDIRRHCTRAIDRLAGSDSFELMLLLVDDDDPVVRLHALHALACDRCKADDVCLLPREELIDLSRRVLVEDGEAITRALALEILGRWVHEDDRALAAIETARTSDPHATVRKKAGWYAPGGKIFERTRPPARPEPRRSQERP